MTHHHNSTGGLNRPVFFDRQSLTAEDLNCLVDYIRAERRRHNRHVIGWGVTSGLAVGLVDDDPWAVRVSAGFAIAPSGAELEVPPSADPFDICAAASECLDIPPACDDPFDLTAEGDNGLAIAGQLDFDFTSRDPGETFDNPLELPFGTITERFQNGGLISGIPIMGIGDHIGLMALMDTRIVLRGPVQRLRLTLMRGIQQPLVQVLDAAGNLVEEQLVTVQPISEQTLQFEAEDISEIRILSDGRDNLIKRIELETLNTVVGNVFLAVCPHEYPACYKPGMPQHCMPPGDNMHPARIREGYEFRILCSLPDQPGLPNCETLRDWMCEDNHLPVPDPMLPDCVVIASIAVGRQGVVSVDEFTHRRQLPPAWVVAAQGACCCCGEPQQPTPTPTPVPTPTPSIFDPSITITNPPSIFDPSITITNPPSIFDPSITVTLPPTIFEPTFTITLQPSIFDPSIGVTLQPSIFEPSFGVTLGPSFFEPTRGATFSPSGIFDPGGAGPVIATPGGVDPVVADPDGLAFDPVRGEELGLDVVPNIGRGRRETLAGMGITSVRAFIEADSVKLAENLRLSEVKIAEMQEEARKLSVESGPTFDRARAAETNVVDVTGISNTRAERLKEIGVETVSDFLLTDRRALAAAIDVSLENVLKLQNTARKTLPPERQ